jgi:prephenate dehydrogenase
LDHAFNKWQDTIPADVIFLCLHYQDEIRFLQKASKSQLIIDVCSSKQKLVSLANRKALRFIGGHPMCGTAMRREKGWNEDLFQDSFFFLSPSTGSLRKDRNFAEKFVRKIGAKPVFVDPAIHDRYLASTSHFPAFLSKLMMESSLNIPDKFKGPGFKSMTRLSQTSPELLGTFLSSNRANIIKTAKRLRSKLDRWIETNDK